MSASGKNRVWLTTRNIIPAGHVVHMAHTNIANPHPHTCKFIKLMQTSLQHLEDDVTNQRSEAIMGIAGLSDSPGGLHGTDQPANGSQSPASSHVSHDIHRTSDEWNGDGSTNGFETHGWGGQFERTQGWESGTHRQYIRQCSSPVSPLPSRTLSNETTKSSGSSTIANSVATDSQTPHFTMTPLLHAVSEINVDTLTATTTHVPGLQPRGFTFLGSNPTPVTSSYSTSFTWTKGFTRTRWKWRTQSMSPHVYWECGILSPLLYSNHLSRTLENNPELHRYEENPISDPVMNVMGESHLEMLRQMEVGS